MTWWERDGHETSTGFSFVDCLGPGDMPRIVDVVFGVSPLPSHHRLHVAPQRPSDTPITISFGAGVNGWAMLHRLVVAGEPFDVALFADTGGEHRATEQFLDWVSEWLWDHGRAPVRLVRYRSRHGNLEQTMRARNVFPGLAYGRRSCSTAYKIDPLDEYRRRDARHHAAWFDVEEGSGAVPEVLIGFDNGETRTSRRRGFLHRKADRVFRNATALVPRPAWFSQLPAWLVGLLGDEPSTEDEVWSALCRRATKSMPVVYRYPLREWGWDRRACVAYLRDHDLPVPPKSSCEFCPSKSQDEIRRLPEHRLVELLAWEDAVVADPRHASPRNGLGGRSRRWRHLLERSEQTTMRFPVSFDELGGHLPCRCFAPFDLVEDEGAP